MQKNYFIWKDHLEAIGLKPVLGKIHLSAITDYQKLYRTLVKIPYEDRIKLCSWEVYCLSGELYALEYAFEQEKITNQTANRWGTNALHHVARSGSKEAVEYIIETLNIDLRSTDNKNANALYYAAKGGSIELMQFLRNEQGLEPSLTTTGINLLHCAALSGSSEAMEYVQETFKIPLKVQTIMALMPSILLLKVDRRKRWNTQSTLWESKKQALCLVVLTHCIMPRGVDQLKQ